MKNWPGQFWLHLIGCCIFLALPFLFSPDGPGSIHDFLSRPPEIRELIHYLLLLVFFYLNYYWFVPRFYFNRQYLLYGIIILLCFFVIAYLPNLIINENVPGRPPMDGGSDIGMGKGPGAGPRKPVGGFWSRVNHNVFLFFALFFFSLLLRIGIKWRQTERERLSSELSYLRAQINPHFLFNTLNSIYSLAIQKSDNTATAIVKLSGMMRYITTEADKQEVALEKELNYISDYVDLQKLRFGDENKVSFTAALNPGSKKIAPLILIGFIENAFKYGINAEEESSIEIKIELVDNDLKLFVHNRKVVHHKMQEEGSGIGIQNTKNRLMHLYPGKHQLEIFDTPDDFIVSLTLQLS